MPPHTDEIPTSAEEAKQRTHFIIMIIARLKMEQGFSGIEPANFFLLRKTFQGFFQRFRSGPKFDPYLFSTGNFLNPDHISNTDPDLLF